MNEKMRKLVYGAALLLGLTFATTSCGDDDNSKVTPDQPQTAKDLDCTQSNVSSWGNYMRIVASLLADDASDLYEDWNTKYENGDSYANFFKGQDALRSVEQLIDGCSDIANEVGTAKIGDPYDLYVKGDTEKALYAVESWYSWHSREDYRNNIYSIRNAYYGSRDGKISEASLSKAVAAVNADLDAKVKEAIDAAAAAIWAIPSPFRNNINSAEAQKAMEACASLDEVLTNSLKAGVQTIDKQVLKAVVANYVDVVVLPTYKDLKERNAALLETVKAFQSAPSSSNFEKCAEAWLSAREPWETSEAFLFGPVADKGLDPNMDSWPLDQDGIVQVLTSGKYDELNWDGDFDEDNDAIAKAQSLRGFHTLEYLIFKDGQARKLQ